MCMALVTFFFVVCSIRTNVVLWLVFVFIDLAFIMLMAVYWTTAEGMTATASKLQTVSASLLNVTVLEHLHETIPYIYTNFYPSKGCRSFHLCILCLWMVPLLPPNPAGRGPAHDSCLGFEQSDYWAVGEEEEKGRRRAHCLKEVTVLVLSRRSLSSALMTFHRTNGMTYVNS